MERQSIVNPPLEDESSTVCGAEVLEDSLKGMLVLHARGSVALVKTGGFR